MSARDDYPPTAANRSLFVDARWNAMCDEIDTLRARLVDQQRGITAAVGDLESAVARLRYGADG